MTSIVAPLVGPARRVVALPPDLREHRRWIAGAALLAGRPLNIDAITVILATKGFESTNAGVPFTRWTTRQLVAFLWGTVGEWCTTQGVELPANLGESLWTYLTTLSEAGELASGSSSLARLREVLVEHAGVNRTGRNRHPSVRRNAAPVRRLVTSGGAVTR